MLLHFLPPWPWPLTFWSNINWWTRYHDGLMGLSHPCAKFGDFSFSRFDLACGQTDSITEADQRCNATILSALSNIALPRDLWPQLCPCHLSLASSLLVSLISLMAVTVTYRHQWSNIHGIFRTPMAAVTKAGLNECCFKPRLHQGNMLPATCCLLPTTKLLPVPQFVARLLLDTIGCKSTVT